MNLVRDQGTGKSKGFAFLAYEDQRSTVLAVGKSTVVLQTSLRFKHSLLSYLLPGEVLYLRLSGALWKTS